MVSLDGHITVPIISQRSKPNELQRVIEGGIEVEVLFGGVTIGGGNTFIKVANGSMVFIAGNPVNLQPGQKAKALIVVPETQEGKE